MSSLRGMGLAVGALVALSVTLGVSACVPVVEEDPLSPVSPGESQSPPGSQAIDLSCDDVIAPDAMYEFNPNFGLVEGFTPAPGSPGLRAVEMNGVACRWVNATSGVAIEVAIARPGAPELAVLRESASSGTVVAASGAEAFFTSENHTGVLQAFTPSTWITLSSTFFVEPDDVRGLLHEVLEAVS